MINGKMLKKSHSAESWEMPWSRKWQKSRILVVPQSQSGRNVNETCLLMCFISVLLLSSSLILISLSIWSLVRKIPYYYLVEIKADIPYFALPAGILGIPTCWIAVSIHNKMNFRFLLLLVILIVLSTILLGAGSIIGFLYSAKIDSTSSGLVNSIENDYLNASVHCSFLKANISTAHKKAWDKIQRQLECCGIVNYHDWIENGMKIPSSCCRNFQATCSSENFESGGCLEALSRDLVWHKNIMKSHAYITILLQLLMIILAVLAYFLNKKNCT